MPGQILRVSHEADGSNAIIVGAETLRSSNHELNLLEGQVLLGITVYEDHLIVDSNRTKIKKGVTVETFDLNEQASDVYNFE